MDNDDLLRMLLACCNKLSYNDFKIDMTIQTEICKLAEVILNGESSSSIYHKD